MKTTSGFFLSLLGVIAGGAPLSAQAALVQHEADGAKAPAVVQPAAKPGSRGFKPLPQKKNGSGVRVNYRLDGTPQVGKPLAITLQFDGLSHPDGGAAEFSADRELTMQAAPKTLRLAPQRAASQQIIVTPRSEGLFYVNVFTEQGGRKSAASIPVQVGKSAANLKSLGPVSTDAKGEKVISMPSQ